MRCGAAFSTFDEEAAGVAEFRTVKVSTAATRQWFGGYHIYRWCWWWWFVVGGGLLTSEVVMGDGCRYAVCDEECA